MILRCQRVQEFFCLETTRVALQLESPFVIPWNSTAVQFASLFSEFAEHPHQECREPRGLEGKSAFSPLTLVRFSILRLLSKTNGGGKGLSFSQEVREQDRVQTVLLLVFHSMNLPIAEYRI